MKKVYLTLTVVSVFGMLMFFGCSKEEAQNKEKQEGIFQPSEKDLQIKGKILDFSSKIDYARENPNLKSGGDDLTLDEAVWNIEALANYNYADASAEFEGYKAETAEIEVPLTDGKVSMVDAAIAYDQMIDTLAQHFSQVPDADKHLVLADVSLKEINGLTATFNVTSGIGTSGSNPFAGFGEDDYWFYANGAGKCGEYIGQGIGSDAAEQIQNKINMRIALPIGHKYFVDINIVSCSPFTNNLVLDNTINCTCCDLINPDDPEPWNNINDFLLFYGYDNSSGYPNFHTCIPPNEMNFYLNSMEHIVYDMCYECFPGELDGKLFASCDLYGDLVPLMDETYIMHIANIRYGVSVGSGDPPKDL